LNRLVLSLVLGAAAGVVDVLPMIRLGTSRHAMASAFVHWLVLGVVITYIQLGLPGWLKGLVVALLAAAPVAILVAETDPAALVPIGVMSSVLGIAVGHVGDRLRAGSIQEQ
jgi:hypothetical protein